MSERIIDPVQDWLDSLPKADRIKRHLHQLRRLRARIAVMEERGVAVIREGIFDLYKSDTQKQIAVIEEELREELKDRYSHVVETLAA